MKDQEKIIDFDTKLLERYIENKRPPLEIRDQLDIGYRKEGQAFEVFEIRPNWMDNSIKMEIPVAKARYVKSRSVWRLYWMRGNLKWDFYEPAGEMTSLSEVLEVIDADTHGCFWG
ncbi:DUF3024 domain-containing protein [Lewinella sp. LCG006]|uniref:DUF3024 domain-containing protein n=1 Tax=Lewinella sp. LCG006 TaxID=3231911 RepID=UPI00345FB9D8